MKPLTPGQSAEYNGVKGKLLALYETESGWNLNIECEDEDGKYVESFIALSDKEKESIKL